VRKKKVVAVAAAAVHINHFLVGSAKVGSNNRLIQ